MNIIRTNREAFRFYVSILLKEIEGEIKCSEKIDTFLEFTVHYMFLDLLDANKYLPAIQRIYDIVDTEINEVKTLEQLEDLCHVSMTKTIFNKITLFPECKNYLLSEVAEVILRTNFTDKDIEDSVEEAKETSEESKENCRHLNKEKHHRIVKRLIKNIYNSQHKIPVIIKAFLKIVQKLY